MNPLLPSPCLASIDDLIPITLFICILLNIVAGLYFKNQKRKLWHETARVALEKGQPIPIVPSDLEKVIGNTSPPPQPSGRGDVKAGLILLAIGIAVSVARPPSWPAGWDIASYVPGFIGVALLLNTLFTFLTTRKNPETLSSSQPPKA